MSARASVGAPERLEDRHDCAAFDCGAPGLNDWLRQQARRNEVTGASRNYVVSVGARVVGFYALATGLVARAAATGKVRRKMPDLIPVMILGRLAVDTAYQGSGLGTGLLRDALLRTLQVAEQAGIRAVVLHAMSEPARRFCERAGFAASPIDPMTMMISIADIERNLTGPTTP
ncbi:MAG: GNAT family N-acetyltransferase [Vicinamibacterales bacterium]